MSTERESDTLDDLNVRDAFTLRDRERFTDRSELDSAPILLLSSDPADGERDEAVRDIQKRLASVCGVELQVPLPTERLPHD